MIYQLCHILPGLLHSSRFLDQKIAMTHTGNPASGWGRDVFIGPDSFILCGTIVFRVFYVTTLLPDLRIGFK
jgi:hypothetical protein